jgi:LacI family transcriptional regulator, repressor for deo operon, udp, cdd, tsx, nupC, and nupG
MNLEEVNSPYRVTIYDVARAAGVAPSTVSRTFSRPGRVRAETAEHVRTVADQLGYRCVYLAPSRRWTTSRLLSIVVADLANPFYAEIVRGAQAAAASAGHVLLVADSQESNELERSVLGTLADTAAGLILASSRMSDSAIRMFAKQAPVVVLNRFVRDVPCILTDSAAGMRGAVRHLIGLGHTELTYLSGPETSWADGIRWRTLVEFAKTEHLRVVRRGPNAPTVQAGLAAAAPFCDSPMSAVIAYNDQLAIGFVRGLRHRGLQVPEQISVVGFDNTMVASLVTPGITTVAAPLHELGSRSVEMLLSEVHRGSRSEAPLTVLPTRLKVRSSSGPRLLQLPASSPRAEERPQVS